MAKLPFIQFFPADWLGDTRPLSLAAKGAWIDILCILHASVTRGERTMPAVAWARAIGATADQAGACIDELANTGVADVVKCGNGDVTVRNRRMLRDGLTREQTRLRVERHRFAKEGDDGGGGATGARDAACNGVGNGVVTPKKTETRRQNTEPPIAPRRGAVGDALQKSGAKAAEEAASGGVLRLDGGGGVGGAAAEGVCGAIAGLSEAGGTQDAGLRTQGEEGAGVAAGDHGLAARGTGQTHGLAARGTRQRNALFDALAGATDGEARELTEPALRKVGVAIAKIRKASPDVTPEEIERRAANYRLHMPTAMLTATALVNHWARCARAPEQGAAGQAHDRRRAFFA